MEKKSDVFSELRKEISKKEDEKSSKESDSSSSNQQDINQNPSNSSKIFYSDIDADKLLKQKRKLRQISMIALFGSLVLIIIVFMSISISQNKSKIDETTLAAKINSKYITLREVSDWKSFLDTQNQYTQRKTTQSEADVLKQLIAYELLINEAKKENLDVSESDINELYDKYNMMAQFSLEKILSAQNISIQEFRNNLKHTLIIQKLFDKVIKISEPDEKDIDEFMNNNKEFIQKQTFGKNLSTQEIRDSIKLTLIDLRKEELKSKYIQNLIDSANIKYYNQFDALLSK